MTRKYGPAEDHTWVSLAQISREIGRTTVQTRKALRKLGFIGIETRPGRDKRPRIMYDTKALEVIKALLSLPHREVTDPSTDWLTQFINSGGEDNARWSGPGSGSGSPKGQAGPGAGGTAPDG